jgi:SAM-dependent methyltransferase
MPTGDPETNAAEIKRWNDDRWTSKWPQREVLTESTSTYLISALGLTPGERAVEIGSGSGRTSLEVAALVGPSGALTAVDVSEALTDSARARAQKGGVSNVSFVVADAQTQEIPGGPFDVAYSKFGVMFFDEPVVAFANIFGVVRGGGRLVFVCWQPVERNTWHTGSVLKPYVPLPVPPGPGKSATGPFTLGDPAHTTSVLEAAGFVSVSHSDHDIVISAPAQAVFDRSQLEFYGVAPGDEDAAMSSIAVHLARFHVVGDRYDFPLAFSVYTARRP